MPLHPYPCSTCLVMDWIYILSWSQPKDQRARGSSISLCLGTREKQGTSSFLHQMFWKKLKGFVEMCFLISCHCNFHPKTSQKLSLLAKPPTTFHFHRMPLKGTSMKLNWHSMRAWSHPCRSWSFVRWASASWMHLRPLCRMGTIFQIFTIFSNFRPSYWRASSLNP